uniref:Uncharacterized protein n=1 Tax=Arundo donax TaxID=35708 RepID=A0A0A9AZL4_ARUDO
MLPKSGHSSHHVLSKITSTETSNYT